MLKYHFTIHIYFKKEVDFNFIENELNLKASKKSSLSESTEKPQLAKILFKTETISDKNVVGLLSEFIIGFQDMFQKINNLCQEYEGICGLVVYFERYSSKSEIKIDLDFEMLKILANNDIYFDIEYKN